MVNIVKSPEIWHRDDFPLLCNWRKLWRAVEVGVDRGEFAQMFLNRWQGHEYFGIDPYLSFPGFDYDRAVDRQIATIRFERHASRARIILSDSATAASKFPTYQDRVDRTTDFVYIDADHSYLGAKADIDLWWPLVSDIGILAGHDFDRTHPGVMQAVSEFAVREKVVIYVTQEAECPSWYCYKNGIPGPTWVRNSN